ncbi:MAG: hypothetical protein HYU66_18735, partial [Armatimonadetes bacterium]|nr:hypothetical protein [Armatimonadota bacterium]
MTSSWLRQALPGVVLCAALPALGSGWEDMTVAPRWGTVWLSPRLTANWVNLTYADMLTQRPAPVGEVVFDLPAGVQCLWAFEVRFHQSPPADGRSELVLEQVPMDGTKGVFLLLASKLPVGTVDQGRSWARWEGGRTRAAEFAVRVIDVPVARQPKRLMTGVATWPYMIDNWPDFQRQFASFGCNQMDLWHTAIYLADRYTEKPRPPALDYVARLARTNRELGISTAVDASIWWDEGAMSDDPDAHALFADGTRSGPCPSYRGPGFTRGMQKNVAIAQSGISWVQSDEEVYGNGNFTRACVCPRCEARWREWLKASRPELDYLPPKTVITEREAHPEQWRAWLWFRAALTTERYRLYRAELARVVGQTKASSSPQPRLGWWAGAAEDHTLLHAMQDARGLASVVDQIIPQLYFR